MRVLLVTQMWPSAENPDLGSFLVPIKRELEASGHSVEVVSISRRGGGPAKYALLLAAAVRAARRVRPDVVFAHFLFPAGFAGAAAARACGAPLVVMAHGQDVANLGEIRGVSAATRRVLASASELIVNSRWLAERLGQTIPLDNVPTTIIDCGIDLEAFSPIAAERARAELEWEPPRPALLCVGSLIERKNVERLADAFERMGRGSLTFVGDGPLRERLEGRPDIRITGRIPHEQVPRWVAACDLLCQPSLIEPFGQAVLEGMAMERSILGTTVGGPPEFVTAESGVLADPLDLDDLAAAMLRAVELPTPNPAAREAAARHDVRLQVGRMAAVLERAIGASGARSGDTPPADGPTDTDSDNTSDPTH